MLKSSLPILDNPARAVLLHDGVVWPEGLFPSHSLDVKIFAPSYKLKSFWVIRGLTMPERLRLHQLLLYMDPLLAGLSPCGLLPFEDSLSPEVYTSFFCQLWGASVGGLDMVDAEEVCGDDRVEEDFSKEETDSGECKLEEKGKMQCDDSMTVSVTASSATSGPDTASTSIPPVQQSITPWRFKDIGFIVGRDDYTQLTDEDTVTSLASEEIICCSWRNGNTLEDHKMGPAPKSDPGPPFAVGQVIMCDVPGHPLRGDPIQSVLQRGFVLEAENPRYMI